MSLRIPAASYSGYCILDTTDREKLYLLGLAEYIKYGLSSQKGADKPKRPLEPTVAAMETNATLRKTEKTVELEHHDRCL